MKIRSPLKTFGGKFYQSDWINKLLPVTDTYVEGFAGGANVLLNRPKSINEYLIEINPNIWTVYDFLKNFPLDLILSSLKRLGYCEEAFEISKSVNKLNNNKKFRNSYDNACVIIQNRFSRGGLGQSFAKSNRLRGGKMGDENAWLTFIDQVPLIHKRLQSVTLRDDSFMTWFIINENNLDDRTTIYLDPPYLSETRVSKKIYEYEMSYSEHERLLDLIKNSPCKIGISSYDNELYNKKLSGWQKFTKDFKARSGQGKKLSNRTEVLYRNF